MLHLLVCIRDLGREIAIDLTYQATQVSTESVQERLQRLAAAIGSPLYLPKLFKNALNFCQVVRRIFFFMCMSLSSRFVRHHNSTRSPRTLQQGTAPFITIITKHRRRWVFKLNGFPCSPGVGFKIVLFKTYPRV